MKLSGVVFVVCYHVDYKLQAIFHLSKNSKTVCLYHQSRRIVMYDVVRKPPILNDILGDIWTTIIAVIKRSFLNSPAWSSTPARRRIRSLPYLLPHSLSTFSFT